MHGANPRLYFIVLHLASRLSVRNLLDGQRACKSFSFAAPFPGARKLFKVARLQSEIWPQRLFSSQAQGALKGRQQKGETGPGTHIFADFCRFSLIFGSLCKSRDLGVADLRRKPQIFAGNRRFLQKPASPICCLPFGAPTSNARHHGSHVEASTHGKFQSCTPKRGQCEVLCKVW